MTEIKSFKVRFIASLRMTVIEFASLLRESAAKWRIKREDMKIKVLFMVYILAVAISVTLQSCRQLDDTSGRASEPPPLVVGKNAPLLLDEPTGNERVTTEADVKNATCYVCHANYTEEPLAQWHAKANISCAECHGESIAHKNDENHLTPPDKMYPVSEIDGACLKCHATHDVQPAEVVRRWQQHTGDKKTDVLCKQCHEGHDVPAAAVVRKWQKQSGQNVYEKPIVCTDCHGEHRLKMRSVRY